VLKKFYTRLARLAETDHDVHASHSLDEADDLHAAKLAATGPRAHRVRDRERR